PCRPVLAARGYGEAGSGPTARRWGYSGHRHGWLLSLAPRGSRPRGAVVWFTSPGHSSSTAPQRGQRTRASPVRAVVWQPGYVQTTRRFCRHNDASHSTLASHFGHRTSTRTRVGSWQNTPTPQQLQTCHSSPMRRLGGRAGRPRDGGVALDERVMLLGRTESITKYPPSSERRALGSSRYSS